MIFEIGITWKRRSHTRARIAQPELLKILSTDWRSIAEITIRSVITQPLFRSDRWGLVDMPLLKLWNSLIGRPAAAKQPEAEPVETKPAPVAPTTTVSAAAKAVASPEASQPRVKKTTKKKSPVAPAVRLAPFAEVAAPESVKPEPAKPARQYKVVTRGEHAEICRLVVEAAPTSVLEIGVGDGLRSDAVMQSLLAVSGGRTLRYAAIDQFEMVGGPITLKDFHLRMRAIDVRPQVFPEPVAQGLSRFSRTVGFADVVIASITDEALNSEEIKSLIARITRPTSVLLHLSGGRWKRTVVSHPQKSNASKAA